jgi:hypothetical protein
MAKIKIVDTRQGVPREQMLDLEDEDFSVFVGRTIVNVAMLGEILRVKYVYVLEQPQIVVTGLVQIHKPGGKGEYRKIWERTYTLIED